MEAFISSVAAAPLEAELVTPAAIGTAANLSANAAAGIDSVSAAAVASAIAFFDALETRGLERFILVIIAPPS